MEQARGEGDETEPKLGTHSWPGRDNVLLMAIQNEECEGCRQTTETGSSPCRCEDLCAYDGRAFLRFDDLIMPKERITRRQKDVSRLLREKKKIQRDQLKKFKKKK